MGIQNKVHLKFMLAALQGLCANTDTPIHDTESMAYRAALMADKCLEVYMRRREAQGLEHKAKEEPKKEA